MNLNARTRIKRLKLLLIDHELELKDLASSTGLSISLIGKIAAGFRNPTPHAILRLENFFGERIFSSPREYRARQKKLRPSIIEFIDSPLPQDDDNSTGSAAAPKSEQTP